MAMNGRDYVAPSDIVGSFQQGYQGQQILRAGDYENKKLAAIDRDNDRLDENLEMQRPQTFFQKVMSMFGEHLTGGDPAKAAIPTPGSGGAPASAAATANPRVQETFANADPVALKQAARAHRASAPMAVERGLQATGGQLGVPPVPQRRPGVPFMPPNGGPPPNSDYDQRPAGIRGYAGGGVVPFRPGQPEQRDKLDREYASNRRTSEVLRGQDPPPPVPGQDGPAQPPETEIFHRIGSAVADALKGALGGGANPASRTPTVPPRVSSGERPPLMGTSPPASGGRMPSPETRPAITMGSPSTGAGRFPAGSPPPTGAGRTDRMGAAPPTGDGRFPTGAPPPAGRNALSGQGAPPPPGAGRNTQGAPPPTGSGRERDTQGAPPPTGQGRSGMGAPPPTGSGSHASSGERPPHPQGSNTPAGDRQIAGRTPPTRPAAPGERPPAINTEGLGEIIAGAIRDVFNGPGRVDSRFGGGPPGGQAPDNRVPPPERESASGMRGGSIGGRAGEIWDEAKDVAGRLYQPGPIPGDALGYSQGEGAPSGTAPKPEGAAQAAPSGGGQPYMYPGDGEAGPGGGSPSPYMYPGDGAAEPAPGGGPPVPQRKPAIPENGQGVAAGGDGQSYADQENAATAWEMARRKVSTGRYSTPPGIHPEGMPARAAKPAGVKGAVDTQKEVKLTRASWQSWLEYQIPRMIASGNIEKAKAMSAEVVTSMMRGSTMGFNQAAAAARLGDWTGAAHAFEIAGEYMPDGLDWEITPHANGMSLQAVDEETGEPIDNPIEINNPAQLDEYVRQVADPAKFAEHILQREKLDEDRRHSQAAEGLQGEANAIQRQNVSSDAEYKRGVLGQAGEKLKLDKAESGAKIKADEALAYWRMHPELRGTKSSTAAGGLKPGDMRDAAGTVEEMALNRPDVNPAEEAKHITIARRLYDLGMATSAEEAWDMAQRIDAWDGKAGVVHGYDGQALGPDEFTAAWADLPLATAP